MTINRMTAEFFFGTLEAPRQQKNRRVRSGRSKARAWRAGPGVGASRRRAGATVVLAFIASLWAGGAQMPVWAAEAVSTAQPSVQPIPPASAPALPPGLAPVVLSGRARQLIGVQFATARQEELSDRIDATGYVEPDEQLEAYVQTRFAGWIRQLLVNQTYQHVKKGQPLFTVYSPELVNAENDYLLALEAARQMDRSSVDGVANGAQALVDGALTRLRLFGVAPGEIGRLRRERTVREAAAIDAPMSGYVVDRAVLPNMYVQPATRLYAITQLSTVWVYAAVYQDQLGEVKVGDPVTLTVDAYPGRTFQGRVDFIWPALDTATRTARVRCAFDNRQGLLKLGMYVRMELRPRLGRALTIPDSAVFRTGLHNVVFIDRGEGYLEPAEVELGAHAGGRFVVRKGLRAGERVVSSANFLVDSESQLQAALGGYVPPPPGVSVAANAPSATIELSTKPSPPRKGTNQVLISVRDAARKPVTGAEVRVVFIMPAMPAMGMAAMRAEAKCEPVGDGLYAATIVLESGGTWNVTVAASRAGQQIASKQLNVTATGGM